jgi:predicted TPR repeat methyltransferase
MPEITIDQALQLAVNWHRQGKLDEAQQIYRQILAAQPAHADALHLLGVSEWQRGHAESAENWIRRALAHKPKQAGFHSNLGNVLRTRGQLTKAIAAYRRALELDPRHADAWNNLGVALQVSGQFEEAAKCHARSADFQPNNAGAYANLGNAQRSLGRLAEAEANYRRAIALAPTLAEAHHNLAVTLGELDRPAEALAACAEALRLRPNWPEALHEMADALDAVGRREEAVEHLRRAVALRPDNAAWQFDLAALSGDSPPAAAPPTFVTDLFDTYAPRFDQHLTESLHYRVPELLLEMFSADANPAPRSLDVLDLGCGTGLVGAQFKPLARSLVGVDLSPRMIDRARARQIYDQLHLAEISAFLQSAEEQFDLVLAADLLIYIGELEPLFAQVARALRSGGTFALSVETTSDADRFQLRPTRRYAHAIAYVQEAARAVALRQVAAREATLRQQDGNDVGGWLALLRK